MFSLIYITQHTSCGQHILLSDYRFKSREDLHQNIIPLKLHCSQCWSEIDATHFEVWESEGVKVRETIEATPIDQLKELSIMIRR